MKWIISEKITPEIDNALDGLHPIVKQILYNRGVYSSEEAIRFLSVDSASIQDCRDLSDIDIAVNTIIEARDKKEKIFIYGDYDVDGISATSIMWDFLYRKLGISVMPYIPSRFEEGYGMSEKGLNHVIENGGSLVITVDCGIKDIDLVKDFTDKGLKFIITDHHTLPADAQGDPIYPDKAIAVVHPKHPHSRIKFKEVCGTTVAWKLICAITNNLKEKENFDFDPEEYLDIVSMATITDIMPLVDENRTIIKKGLEQIKNTKNMGLRALMLESKVLPSEVETYHFGFVLGPRLNATGRMEHALEGVRLLSTSSDKQALEIAAKLSQLNLERQQITQSLLDQAMSQIEDNNENLIFVYGEEWPEGVIGLVAGKLLEKYHKPVLVGSVKDGIMVGSARSIESFNVTEAIAASADLLLRFGGHAQAAGFSLEEKNAQKFKENLLKLAANISDEDLLKKLRIDAVIKPQDVTIPTINEVESLRPFGPGNPTPNFLLEDLTVHEKSFMGKEALHVKLLLTGGTNIIEAVSFNNAQNYTHINPDDKIDIVATLSKNVWNGVERPQLKIIDIKKHENKD